MNTTNKIFEASFCQKYNQKFLNQLNNKLEINNTLNN